MRAFHENRDRLKTENHILLTLRAPITNCSLFLSSGDIFIVSSRNSVNPDQTVPVGVV